MKRATLALLAIAGIWPGHVHASDTEKPFDPVDCWCTSARMLDLNIGSTFVRNADTAFRVDMPLTAGLDGRLRQVGEVIQPFRSGSLTGLGGGVLMLVYERDGRGEYCSIAVPNMDIEQITLASVACGRRQVNSTHSIPESCTKTVTLATVVEFAKAREEKGMSCERAAAKFIGVHPPDPPGCDFSLSGIILGMGGVGTLLNRRGRRPRHPPERPS